MCFCSTSTEHKKYNLYFNKFDKSSDKTFFGNKVVFVHTSTIIHSWLMSLFPWVINLTPLNLHFTVNLKNFQVCFHSMTYRSEKRIRGIRKVVLLITVPKEKKRSNAVICKTTTRKIVVENAARTFSKNFLWCWRFVQF